MTAPVLQVGVDSLMNWLGNVLGLVPRLFVAAVLVVAAYLLGRVAAGKVEALADRMALGEAVMETPLSVLFRSDDEIGDVLGTTTQYLFVLFGVVIGASMAGFNRVFDVGRFVLQYAPSVIGAIAIVLVGFVVAGYVARSVKASDAVGGTAFTPIIATTIQTVIYFVSVTLALDSWLDRDQEVVAADDRTISRNALGRVSIPIFRLDTHASDGLSSNCAGASVPTAVAWLESPRM